MDSEQARQILVMPAARGEHKKAFDGLDLTSAFVHPESWFDRCSFVGTDFRLATLDGAHFKMCDLTGANLQGASLRGASFAGCNLVEADLRNADLTGAEFGYVNTGTDTVGRTDVTGANLTAAILRDLRLDRVIGWPAHLSKAL